mmetsp:Transcript_8220/g.15477  ORF Transcript_8220/g.15477 Transcript_8220/m.15477 type:complete len:1017 (+) Transcript_8220:83-3133(+)
MGNCKSKSINHVIGPSYPDDSKGVFRYDKDSRKILFVGEDAEDTEITGLESSQSYVSTSTKSADASGVHAEPVERSLLGEIAEYLENDGDDSTVNTMSTRGRNSPMLYNPKSQDSKPGMIKLTNDPYYIRTVLSDGTSNSDETADTSILDGLNHLKSADSQSRKEYLQHQDPDPEDWDDDYVSANTCKETRKSPTRVENVLDCDAVLQTTMTDKENCSSAHNSSSKDTSKEQSQVTSSRNHSNDCHEILEIIMSDETSNTSNYDDRENRLQTILSSKSDDMEEFYDDGYIPLSKSNSSDSSSESYRAEQNNQTQHSTGEAKESKYNLDQEITLMKSNLKKSDMHDLAVVADDIQDHIQRNRNVPSSRGYEEEETPESHGTRSALNELEEKHFIVEESLSMGDLEANEDVANYLERFDMDDMAVVPDDVQDQIERNRNVTSCTGNSEQEAPKSNETTSASDELGEKHFIFEESLSTSDFESNEDVVDRLVESNIKRSDMDDLAGGADDIQDHIERNKGVASSTGYAEEETPESCEKIIISNDLEDIYSIGEEYFPLSGLESSEEVAKEDVASDSCRHSIEKRQIQDKYCIQGSKSIQNSLLDAEIENRQIVTKHNKVEGSDHSQISKVNELKLSMNDVSFSDFSANQDLVSETENGISFDEEDDTDLSRDDSLYKEDNESTYDNENNSYLSNVPDEKEKTKTPVEIKKEHGNSLAKENSRNSEEYKASAVDCEIDNQAIIDELSCLLDESLGRSGDSDNRSPLMSPETVVNNDSSNRKVDVLSNEVTISGKRSSFIPRVPQYSPIRCSSPYRGHRKSAIQPPSPARLHPRTLLDATGLETEHQANAICDDQTPKYQNTKTIDAYFSGCSVSSRGDLSVTPQSLPWDEIEGSRCVLSQQKSLPRSIKSSVGTPKSSSKSRNNCASKWDPYLHMEKKGCERCLTLCSGEERDDFFEFGRHQRVTKTCGGCTKNCSLYGGERFHDSEAVVLCRICFHAVHRRSHIKSKDPTVRSLTTEYH